MGRTGLRGRAPAARLAEWRTLWPRFRSWRRSRPFWGGLLALLSGLILVAIPLLGLRLVFITGSGISLALIVGALILIGGAFMWLAPGYSPFLGVLVILFSLVSFVTTDFGGFLVGMLLGLVGGSIAVAWIPGEVPSTASVLVNEPGRDSPVARMEQSMDAGPGAPLAEVRGGSMHERAVVIATGISPPSSETADLGGKRDQSPEG